MSKSTLTLLILISLVKIDTNAQNIVYASSPSSDMKPFAVIGSKEQNYVLLKELHTAIESDSVSTYYYKSLIRLISHNKTTGTNREIVLINDSGRFQDIYSFDLINGNLLVTFKDDDDFYNPTTSFNLHCMYFDGDLNTLWDTLLINPGLSKTGDIDFVDRGIKYLDLYDSSLVYLSIDPKLKKINQYRFNTSILNPSQAIASTLLTDSDLYFYESSRITHINFNTLSSSQVPVSFNPSDVYAIEFPFAYYYGNYTNNNNKNKITLNSLNISNGAKVAIDTLETCLQNDSLDILYPYFDEVRKLHTAFSTYKNKSLQRFQIEIVNTDTLNNCISSYRLSKYEELKNDAFNVFSRLNRVPKPYIGMQFRDSLGQLCAQIFDTQNGMLRYTPKIIYPSTPLGILHGYPSGSDGADSIHLALFYPKELHSTDKIVFDVLPFQTHIPTTISEHTHSEKLAVYYASNVLNIKSEVLNYKLKIFTILGAKIYARDGTNDSMIDISFLPTGLYIADIQQGNTVQRLKFYKP